MKPCYYQTNIKKKTNKITDLDTIVTRLLHYTNKVTDPDTIVSSNKVITLLDKIRIDKMGVEMI